MVVSLKNQFRIGDAVAHPKSQQRGIVREVKGDWVKFESIGKNGPDGKPILVRFAYGQLVLLAKAEALQKSYAELQQKELEALRKNSQLHRRFARWFRNLFRKKNTSGLQTVRS